jgi:hypothetical protein
MTNLSPDIFQALQLSVAAQVPCILRPNEADQVIKALQGNSIDLTADDLVERSKELKAYDRSQEVEYPKGSEG